MACCKSPPCDKFTADGACPNGECKPGYKGDNCSIQCDMGFFGEDCLNQCYCNEGTCNHVTGLGCGECADGFTGKTCSEIQSTATETSPTTPMPTTTTTTIPTTSTTTQTSTTTTLPTTTTTETFEISSHIASTTILTTTTTQTTTSTPTISTTTTENSRAATGTSSASPTIPTTIKTTRTEPEELSTETKDTFPIPGGDTQTQRQGRNTQDNTRSGFNVPIIVGSVIGVIVALVVILTVIFLTRRRRAKAPGQEIINESEPHQEPETPVIPQVPVKPIVQESQPQLSTSSHELLDETTDNSDIAVEIKENTYANVSGDESKTKLKLQDVGAFIENQKTQKHPFLDEYTDIPKKTASWSEAEVDELKFKNRYINIYPYNHNRVKLQAVDDSCLSSYINASYVKDYDDQVSYIAALGSTEQTRNDTWRMIWEAGISNIVMVTNLMEDSKMKCVKYWPFGKSAQFGDIFVTIENEEHHQHYVKRTMKASFGNNSRSVTHFHYTAWPDKQAPANLSSVLYLREIVKDLRVHKNIPILIHCSAGIGRTGTLIALDILLDQAEKEDAIDVYRCVSKLREQRTQMVQTLEQYVFLYNSFHELYEVGKTFLPVKDIGSFVKSDTFVSEATKQYSFLKKIRLEIPVEELMFGKVDHAEKNRDENIVAGDGQRVVLTSNPDIYVNAVYVPDYNKAKAYCATQLPLENTVADFWRMVFDLKSVAVVCLETDPSDTWKLWVFVNQFLPGNDKAILSGNIQVRFRETKEEADLTIHHIEINTATEYANVPVKQESDDVHELELFELKSWTSRPIVERGFSQLRSTLEHVQVHTNAEDKKPLIVMCKNGTTETGVYIALSILVDNMEAEHEVDVFQVVKMIRKNRPQFILSQEQYTWLYQAIAEIADHK